METAESRVSLQWCVNMCVSMMLKRGVCVCTVSVFALTCSSLLYLEESWQPFPLACLWSTTSVMFGTAHSYWIADSHVPLRLAEASPGKRLEVSHQHIRESDHTLSHPPLSPFTSPRTQPGGDHLLPCYRLSVIRQHQTGKHFRVEWSLRRDGGIGIDLILSRGTFVSLLCLYHLHCFRTQETGNQPQCNVSKKDPLDLWMSYQSLNVFV